MGPLRGAQNWQRVEGRSRSALRHALGVDDQFDPPVARSAALGGVRDHRMVGSMANDEQLLGGQGAALGLLDQATQ